MSTNLTCTLKSVAEGQKRTTAYPGFVMTSFLDIRDGYDTHVIRTVYYYVYASAFGMEPT